MAVVRDVACAVKKAQGLSITNHNGKVIRFHQTGTNPLLAGNFI